MRNIAVKTGFPHPRGIWSWDRQGHHTILVIRNPMDTFKDFHNIACEISPAVNRSQIWQMLREKIVYTKNWNTQDWNSWLVIIICCYNILVTKSATLLTRAFISNCFFH